MRNTPDRCGDALDAFVEMRGTEWLASEMARRARKEGHTAALPYIKDRRAGVTKRALCQDVAERREILFNLVQETQPITPASISRMTGMKLETVRDDMHALKKKGKLTFARDQGSPQTYWRTT